jgi:Baseplate J-like protein
MTAALSVAQLFIPMPSGVGPNGLVPLSPGTGTWLGNELAIANDVQLPTTSWQSGAPERTIFAIEAVCFSLSDANISQLAQGGFLQSAATGTVTFTTVDGTTVTIPVTPDPSNPAQNPTGALGLLDLLGQGVYDTFRLSATQATGPLALANVGGSTIGPYAPGTYHVENTQTGATYRNPASLSVPSSQIAGTGGVVTAFTVGASFSIVQTQSAHGLVAGDVVYLAMPSTTGVVLSSAFGIVTSSTSTTFQVSIPSTGTYTSGGTVYLCTVATMQADLAGSASNAGPGAVTTAVTQNAGVFVSNVVGWSGSNWESNLAYLDRCLLALASRSPNGASQAYVYFAETAQQLLAAATPAYQLTNGPVTAFNFSNPQTGIVTTVVASQTPASTTLGQPVTPGCSQLPISGVSNANPCIVTTSGATGLSPAQSETMTISGVLGTGGVNGIFLGTYVSSNSFSIPVDTTSTGSYTGGGSVEGGDLGQIDNLLQGNSPVTPPVDVVPDNTTALTVSAIAFPTTFTATVIVPAAYVTAYKAAVVVQLAALLASYNIGGNAETVPTFSVSWDDALEALGEAGIISVGQASYVKAVQSLSVSDGVTTITTSGTGIAFPSNLYQALLAAANVTVVGV